VKIITGWFVLLIFLGMPVDAAPRIGQVAPDFECKTSDGQVVRLSDFRGKIVMLDFWASWCGPCREVMPTLINLHRLNKEKGFEILAVNIDTKAKNMETFLEKLDRRPTFPILADRPSPFSQTEKRKWQRFTK
jgi:thiol-disulfide isomerase/thioredoxin